MQNYKDLKVWKSAHQFTLELYQVSRVFPKEETYSLTNQLRRVASSIPANIAEGCGQRTQPDFAYFLKVALGASNEAEYFVLLAKDLNYISEQGYTGLTKLINEIKAMLIVLIGKVRA